MTQVSIICSDVASNSVARAWILAEVLKSDFEVEIVGAQFGRSPWQPIAGYKALLPVRVPYPPAFPAFVKSILRQVSGDVIYASKLRVSSFGLGLLKKRLGVPLALDIDDWEPGYILDVPAPQVLWRLPMQFAHPNGLPYVLGLELLSKRVDLITVASTRLYWRFGGHLLYHVRDTEALNPGIISAERSREDLRVEDTFNIMFLGTPSEHKGVGDLAEAITLAGLNDVRLVIIGPGNKFVDTLEARYSRILRRISEQPIAKLGHFLAAADLVCLPQRPTRYGSFQMPAKLFDAMAMAKPIVATAVSDLPLILDGCGLVVPPLDKYALAAAITELHDDKDLSEMLGRAAREKCIREFSLQSARGQLVPLFKELAESGRARA